MKKIAAVFSKKNKKNFFNLYGNAEYSKSSKNNDCTTDIFKSFRFDTSDVVYHDNYIPFLNDLYCAKRENASMGSIQSYISLANTEVLADDSSLLFNNSVSESEFSVSSKGQQIRKIIKQSQSDIINPVWTNAYDNIHADKKFEPFTKDKSASSPQSKTSNYLITIKNSNNFIIGSKKTININEFGNGNINKANYSIQNIPDSTIEMQKLLHCEEKLSETIVKLIAQNFKSDWKIFGKNLGLNDVSLNEIETKCENEYFMVYEVLQEFINKFPNTTLGFIAYILNENRQLDVVRILCQYTKDIK